MVTIRILFGLAFGLLLFTVVGMWVTGTPHTSWPLLPIMTGICAGVTLGSFAPNIRRWWQTESDRPDPDVPKFEAYFCKDCGEHLVTSSRGSGYDIKTGAPRFDFVRHCASSRFGTAHWPFCGVPHADIPVAQHTHTDLSLVLTTCPLCIDQMFRDGVIPQQTAQTLYEAIGAKLGRKPEEPWDTALTLGGPYASMIKSMSSGKYIAPRSSGSKT